MQTTHRRIMRVAITLSAFVALPASGQVINEDLKLTASDGAANDVFSNSIAIDNGVVAIGARFDDDNGGNSGSAYLFDVSTGAQLIKLLPSDGRPDDNFGFSIAIDNGLVAVGARNGLASGSAYVFNSSTGSQITKLIPSDGATGDSFGTAIAIGDGIIAVGDVSDNENGANSGSVYLFDAATAEQLTKLFPSDGATSDRFGVSIAIGNGVVAIASRDNENGANSGSVYLFDTVTGEQLIKLFPSDGATGDLFGHSVAIDNGVIAIAALGADAAYLFDVSTGEQLFKFFPSGGAPNFFGSSIEMDDGIVAVGASGDNTKSGSAYLFDVSTGEQLAELLPSDGAGGDKFGSTIAIGNGVAVVGALYDDDNGTNSGSAYVFSVAGPCTGVSADLTGDGVLDFFDVSGFLVLFQLNDPIADFTGDGVFDFFDVSAFIQAFSNSCS